MSPTNKLCADVVQNINDVRFIHCPNCLSLLPITTTYNPTVIAFLVLSHITAHVRSSFWRRTG
jgi:hypothetical protein